MLLFDDPEDVNEDDDVAGDLFADEHGSHPSVHESDPFEPKYQGDLIGHEAIESSLCQMINQGRLPHGIIFHGPQGVGKATLAYRLARALLKRGYDVDRAAAAGPGLFGDVDPPEKMTTLHIDRHHQIFQQVIAGGHPDLRVIERAFDEVKGVHKESLSVEQIRDIPKFFQVTSAIENGWRIMIVDDAESMTTAGQNAILKILEEPPAQSIIILVTQRLGALLPTILSRCALFSFSSLAEDKIENILRRAYPSLTGNALNDIQSMACGSVGLALLYADPAATAVIQQTTDLLLSYPKMDWARIQAFAEENRAGPNAMKLFKQTMLWLVHGALKAKATNTSINFPVAQGKTLLESFDLAGWIKICDTLERHFKTAETANLDKRYLVMGAFMVFQKT